MSLQLAIVDAATNCERDGAVALITLRSGVEFTGKLRRPTGADLNTVHMDMPNGGWETIDFDEIAAVGARRRA